ncbi:MULTISPECIES: hypothetical protein [Acinetobacter calcoaceticus/baumannii complex]|uniref:hypothetical protein n=1 Tax=Acinetobacter calcoaceticus/baumannii complex TaxID=909768 RepID=UPI002271079F|nr:MULTISPECIES: hypothetical protein [Acinetobacter calcoaceticus/baumannii complex]MDD9317877.1 hypothetical protein [Acinetobacter lactucae]
MKFSKAIELGLKRAEDAAHIEAEITKLLQELNACLANFTNSDVLAFDFSSSSIQQLSPIEIDFNNFSFPMRISCGYNQSFRVESLQAFEKYIHICVRSAKFGDFIRHHMNKTKL